MISVFTSLFLRPKPFTHTYKLTCGTRVGDRERKASRLEREHTCARARVVTLTERAVRGRGRKADGQDELTRGERRTKRDRQTEGETETIIQTYVDKQDRKNASHIGLFCLSWASQTQDRMVAGNTPTSFVLRVVGRSYKVIYC